MQDEVFGTRRHGPTCASPVDSRPLKLACARAAHFKQTPTDRGGRSIEGQAHLIYNFAPAKWLSPLHISRKTANTPSRCQRSPCDHAGQYLDQLHFYPGHNICIAVAGTLFSWIYGMDDRE